MAKPKKDALDRFAEEANADPKKVIALMFWRERHRNPEMACQITEADIKGFTDCVNYLEVEPEVSIVRPGGRPAQPAIPAAGNRRGVPARPEEPARPFVSVNLVAKGTMNAIKPIENSEEGAKLRDASDTLRRARERAGDVAGQLLRDVASGQFSTSTMQDAAQMLVTLARA